ncbi:hypothetical protein ACFTAO_49405 [Paenibacillus rhizoplanae]
MMDINKFIAPPLQFEVLEHDRVIAKVKLHYMNQTVEVWQDDTVEPVFLPFPGKIKGTCERCARLFRIPLCTAHPAPY